MTSHEQKKHTGERMYKRAMMHFLLGVLLVLVIAGVGFFLILESATRSMAEAQRQRVSERVGIAMSVIRPVLRDARQGNLTDEQARERIAAVVGSMTYSEPKGRANYFFLVSTDGTLLAHPLRRQLEGENLLETGTEPDRTILSQILEAIEANPSGAFVRYEYRTPGSSEPLEKLTLAHPIDDLGLILCTGTWLDQYAGRPLALYGLVAGLAVALLLGLCVPLLLYGRQMHLHNRQLSQEIAEHEQTRLALEQAKETAEAASRAKTEFLAVISHEIRTPLNAVIGFADFLSQSTEDPSQREVIEEINNNSEHLLTLIDDILNYTSIISGNLELSYRPFSVARVVEEVVSANAFKINEKGLQLHREISPNVPGHLEGDPVRVRQVLSNLVDNAVKFTARGSVWLKAWANKTAEGDWLLHFMVKDTGPGVPAERVESIFNRFEQIDSSNTRRFGGVGLGLAICKSIVERMGGQIRCRSEDGGGAEFTFEIRCREVDVPSGGGFHAKLPETQVQPNGEAVRIVYAEDNPSNQRLMEALLQPHGFDVSIVKDGYGLISSLQSNAYDLALVDLQMPGMDGLEAASRIRRGEAGEHNRQLPIIGITAHALRGDRERCLDSGMDGYLPKPIRQAELLEAIHETLSRRV